MTRFLRLTLPMLLALALSGMPALVNALVEASCADEESEGAGCCHCSPTCSGCTCCPIRTAVTTSLPLPPFRPIRVEFVLAGYRQPVVAQPCSDIFHPPRA